MRKSHPQNMHSQQRGNCNYVLNQILTPKKMLLPVFFLLFFVAQICCKQQLVPSEILQSQEAGQKLSL